MELNFLTFQVVYGDVYMLDDEMKWKILPPMPKPDSHIECAWVIVNNSIIITGGTTEKHPVTKRMMLVGEVFQFHLDTMVHFSVFLLIRNRLCISFYPLIPPGLSLRFLAIVIL